MLAPQLTKDPAEFEYHVLACPRSLVVLVTLRVTLVVRR